MMTNNTMLVKNQKNQYKSLKDFDGKKIAAQKGQNKRKLLKMKSIMVKSLL